LRSDASSSCSERMGESGAVFGISGRTHHSGGFFDPLRVRA
jgi:hypothetical protein